jgi:xanthine dehydrogenase accessory factor
MFEWLTALLAQQAPAVLITVAQAEGSVPREAGAKMLVAVDRQFDTIGGGHLELTACNFAREMLAGIEGSGVRRLERFALGPTLGQCCGGVAYLAFELVDAADHPLYLTLQQRLQSGQHSWRVSNLDVANAATMLMGPDGECIARTMGKGAASPASGIPPIPSPSCRLMQDEYGQSHLIDPVLPHMPHLFLFGAGHVGTAIVNLLQNLPCRVTWVDEREDLFPPVLPANVTAEATDTPEAVIDGAPAGASFLVMTHSHALDQHLAEQILRRDDIGWFGLIGSRTKRIQFERRLLSRGIQAESLARMVCPIGVRGIHGKMPAVIAVAVVAQLLLVWEQQLGMSTEVMPERSCG